ncbi:hypothetical protein V8E55_003435 [Tylopilus felleus]
MSTSSRAHSDDVTRRAVHAIVVVIRVATPCMHSRAGPFVLPTRLFLAHVLDAESLKTPCRVGFSGNATRASSLGRLGTERLPDRVARTRAANAAATFWSTQPPGQPIVALEWHYRFGRAGGGIATGRSGDPSSYALRRHPLADTSGASLIDGRSEPVAGPGDTGCVVVAVKRKQADPDRPLVSNQTFESRGVDPQCPKTSGHEKLLVLSTKSHLEAPAGNVRAEGSAAASLHDSRVTLTSAFERLADVRLSCL